MFRQAHVSTNSMFRQAPCFDKLNMTEQLHVSTSSTWQNSSMFRQAQHDRRMSAWACRRRVRFSDALFIFIQFHFL